MSVSDAKREEKVRERRRPVVAWARRLLADPERLLIFDTETTGLSASDEVLQIAVVSGKGETLLSTLVNPGVSVHEKAFATHGLGPVDYGTAPRYPEIASEVDRLFLDREVLAYNVDFDWRFVCQTAAAYQLPPPRPARLHCLMKQYSLYAGEWDWRLKKWRWHKLSAALKAMAIENEGQAHDATYDALQTLALLRAIAEENLK